LFKSLIKFLYYIIKDLSPILPTLSTNLYNKFTTSETYELYDETVHVLNELHNNRKIKLGVISNLDERIGMLYTNILSIF
jgi:hypothetical protein